MSGRSFMRTLAVAVSASLLVSAMAGPSLAKPDKEAKAAAKVAAKAERQARAEARAGAKADRREAKVAKQAEQAARKAAKREARAGKKVERKAEQGGQAKVEICHKAGTPDEQTLTIAEPAVKAHLGHGDELGACGTSPSVNITGPGIINPGSWLHLNGEASPVTTTWSYRWSSTCLTQEELVDIAVNGAKPDTEHVRIRPDILTEGMICDFTLTATDEATGGQASATVTVYINEPPEGGLVAVDPMSGIALETHFQLTAPGWSDPQTPLWYQWFYEVPGGDDVALTNIINEPYADAYLRQGEYTIYVRVWDRIGAMSTATITDPVTVENP